MIRRAALLVTSIVALSLFFIPNVQAQEKITWKLTKTAALNCYTFNWGHPSSPGIYEDPCSHREWTASNGSLRLAETVNVSWVANGSDVKVNAVQTVARIQDLTDFASGIQVEFINVGFFNGGGLLDTCATCPANSQGNDLLVTTPWDFGVGCGNTATGHSAGDEVWNHARYSTRNRSTGLLAYWDETGADGATPVPTYSAATFIYFAPRSVC
jgi:hypothetical protein